MRHALKSIARAFSNWTGANDNVIGARMRTFYKVECFDKDGNLKWVESCENLVTTAGATDLLAKYFKGSAYTAAWYVGLYKGTGTLATADTMASHAGWTDSTDYSNASRPAWTGGTPSAGSVDNSASVAVFNINATATILGAYLVSDNTKGGTTGVLYGEAAFGASRSVISGDTLNVTVTLTAA
ncbi:MAG: hypothetical protein ACR652_21160 [Methylocystis sp.]|uniref:hypothetical protein n=1 Tax=Methylocystis sp. TaxID=1911079 RepID=UPI003DA3F94D